MRRGYDERGRRISKGPHQDLQSDDAGVRPRKKVPRCGRGLRALVAVRDGDSVPYPSQDPVFRGAPEVGETKTEYMLSGGRRSDLHDVDQCYPLLSSCHNCDVLRVQKAARALL